jgi:hypothetical protein
VKLEAREFAAMDLHPVRYLIAFTVFLIPRSADVVAQPGVLSYIADNVRVGRFAVDEVAVAREHACPADEQAIIGTTSDDAIRIDLEHSSISADMKYVPLRMNVYEEVRISIKH